MQRIWLWAFLLLIGGRAGQAQLDDLVGLSGLQDVPLEQLSEQDESLLGKKALSLHPEEWKHAEAEHFIYHYVKNFVASRAAVEAEFNYRVISNALEKEPPNEHKSHIYFFERPEDWAEFQKTGKLEQWTGGITAGNSLFLLRDPRYKFSGNTLGHEIAHLVLHRVYGDGIPCWLNEGFAEYISRNTRASYERARHYLARPHSYSLNPKEVIAVPELISLTYPPNQRVETFYDESERLVRFLTSAGKERFLTFLEVSSKGGRFEPMLLQSYAGIFANRADFETRFRAYVSEDFGSSLQDQP